MNEREEFISRMAQHHLKMWVISILPYVIARWLFPEYPLLKAITFVIMLVFGVAQFRFVLVSWFGIFHPWNGILGLILFVFLLNDYSIPGRLIAAGMVFTLGCAPLKYGFIGNEETSLLNKIGPLLVMVGIIWAAIAFF